jgi:acyl-CoA reductase-like NAD-dependent aldehyde dehydrogenase
MAVQDTAPTTDRDLASVAEARSLARAARQAQPILAEFTQQQIDAIVTAMAEAVTPQAEALARLAVEETGYGVVADKVQKNLFGSRQSSSSFADEDRSASSTGSKTGRSSRSRSRSVSWPPSCRRRTPHRRRSIRC